MVRKRLGSTVYILIYQNLQNIKAIVNLHIQIVYKFYEVKKKILRMVD